ncbi:MAG: DMT family transporter [Vulcanimicrobiaceae bacterium]
MRASPLQRGFLWAVAAALSFGVTTPLIALASGSTGAWFTAATLYFGAALFAAAIQGSPRRSVATLRRNARTYAVVAIAGGMLAPAAFTAGLQRAGPLGSSLALNLEGAFSVAIAALVFREHIGRRLLVAAAAILGGGVLLARQGGGDVGSSTGIGLVVLATALWAIDNAVSSSLRGADTRVTVFWKSLLGATLASGVGIAAHEPLAPVASLAALLAIGAFGYGASLWWYLQAQRTFGVARTASLFAIAPFVGAAFSIALHAGHVTGTTVAVMLLMAAGVALHSTERHGHRHRHEPLEHEHLHEHDDGHHAHHGTRPFAGEHLHAHRHDATLHDHPHAPDPHHAHAHDAPPHAAVAEVRPATDVNARRR